MYNWIVYDKLQQYLHNKMTTYDQCFKTTSIFFPSKYLKKWKAIKQCCNILCLSYHIIFWKSKLPLIYNCKGHEECGKIKLHVPATSWHHNDPVAPQFLLVWTLMPGPLLFLLVMALQWNWYYNQQSYKFHSYSINLCNLIHVAYL